MHPARKNIFSTGTLALSLLFAAPAAAQEKPGSPAESHAADCKSFHDFATGADAMKQARRNIEYMSDPKMQSFTLTGQVAYYEKETREVLEHAVQLDPALAKEAAHVRNVLLPAAVKAAHLNGARTLFGELEKQADTDPVRRDSFALMFATKTLESVDEHLRLAQSPVSALFPKAPPAVAKARYRKVADMVADAEARRAEIQQDFSIGSPKTAAAAMMEGVRRISRLENLPKPGNANAADITRTADEAAYALAKAARLDPALAETTAELLEKNLPTARQEAHLNVARTKFVLLIALAAAGTENLGMLDKSLIKSNIADVKDNLAAAGKQIADLDPKSPPAFVEKIFEQTVKILTEPAPPPQKIPGSPSRQRIITI